MRVTELDDLLIKLLVESDHPEIASVERVATAGRPDDHTRVVVRFASGGRATIMVTQVTGPDGRQYPKYQLPREVL